MITADGIAFGGLTSATQRVPGQNTQIEPYENRAFGPVTNQVIDLAVEAKAPITSQQ